MKNKLEEVGYEEAVRTAKENPRKKPSFWLHEECADAKLVEAGVDDAQSFQSDEVPLLDSYITEVTNEIKDWDPTKLGDLVARAKTLLRWCLGDGFGRPTRSSPRTRTSPSSRRPARRPSRRSRRRQRDRHSTSPRRGERRRRGRSGARQSRLPPLTKTGLLATNLGTGCRGRIE